MQLTFQDFTKLNFFEAKLLQVTSPEGVVALEIRDLGVQNSHFPSLWQHRTREDYDTGFVNVSCAFESVMASTRNECFVDGSSRWLNTFTLNEVTKPVEDEWEIYKGVYGFSGRLIVEPVIWVDRWLVWAQNCELTVLN